MERKLIGSRSLSFIITLTMFLVIFLGLAVLIIGISVTEKWRDHQLNGLAIAVVAILAVMGYGVWWALNTPIVYFDDNFLYKKNGKEEYSISYSRIEKFSVHSTRYYENMCRLKYYDELNKLRNLNFFLRSSYQSGKSEPLLHELKQCAKIQAPDFKIIWDGINGLEEL